MRDSNVTKKYGAIAHQGNLSFSVSTDTHENGSEYHHLEISLSHYGVVQSSTIPVFASTPNILRLLADELEAKNIRDPKYLAPIITHVTYDDKEDVYFRVVGGKVVQVKREDCYGASEGAQATNAGNSSKG
jgi:hypothetical protein